MSDITAALAALNAEIARLAPGAVPPSPGSAPSPAAYQRPYQSAGHAPLTAPASRQPSIPHNTPAGAFTAQGTTGTRIAGQPSSAPDPVTVPAHGTGNRLSALTPPAEVHVNHLDLSRTASPTTSPALGARNPAGLPIQTAPGIAASGYQDQVGGMR